MRILFYLLFLVIISLGNTSCNSAMQKEYNEATAEQDLEEIHKSGALLEGEYMMLRRAIYEMDRSATRGKTYTSILDFYRTGKYHKTMRTR